MSYVARRKLNFHQLENVLGTSLPAMIKGYATLRDAKITESSHDKVVMWTGGSYDYDDVMCALVWLDRPEMRLGTKGENGKTVPRYFTDPEADAPTPAPGSEIWIQPSIDQPHRNEVLDAFQEDVEICEDGETTIARDGGIAILGVFCFSHDGQETTVEKRCTQGSRFLRSQTWCRRQRAGTAHKTLEFSTAETAYQVCKVPQTRTLGSRVSRRESRTAQGTIDV